MCLQAVRQAFGIPAKYGTATDDWTSGDQQTGTIPSGVSVPVYFSLGTEPAGHVAIRLPDGRIASSTQNGTHAGLYIHPDIKDLMNLYAKYFKTCTYLGWSTEVNDVPVVKLSGGTPMLDELTIKRAIEGAYLEATNALPSAFVIQQKADYVQKVGSFNQVLKDIFSLGPNYIPATQAPGGDAADKADAEKFRSLKKLLS